MSLTDFDKVPRRILKILAGAGCEVTRSPHPWQALIAKAEGVHLILYVDKRGRYTFDPMQSKDLPKACNIVIQTVGYGVHQKNFHLIQDYAEIAASVPPSP